MSRRDIESMLAKLPTRQFAPEDLPKHYIGLMQGSSDPVKEGQCMAGEFRVRPGMVRLETKGENSFVAVCLFWNEDFISRLDDNGETMYDKNGKEIMSKIFHYYLRIVEGWPNDRPQPDRLILQMKPWGAGRAALDINDFISADENKPFLSLLKFSHKQREGSGQKYLAWVVERIGRTPDDMLEELIPDYKKIFQLWEAGKLALSAGDGNGIPQLVESTEDAPPF